MTLNWDIYEITAQSQLLAVKCRGRLRKFAIQEGIAFLTENASDIENSVRFALPTGDSPDAMIGFIKNLFSDAKIECVLQNIPNPVISKLKINDIDRYELP